jgi:hypothetical protein
MIQDLIARATAAGLVLTLVNERVKLTAHPGAQPTTELIRELVSRQSAIAEALAAPLPPPPIWQVLVAHLERVRPGMAATSRRTSTVGQLRQVASQALPAARVPAPTSTPRPAAVLSPRPEMAVVHDHPVAAVARLTELWRRTGGVLIFSADELFRIDPSRPRTWPSVKAVSADLAQVTPAVMQRALASSYLIAKADVEFRFTIDGATYRAIVPALGQDGRRLLERALQARVAKYVELPDPKTLT